MTASTSPLERRYRRWLAWYPPSYRAERGDEIVAVLMEVAGDRTGDRLTPAEALDLVRGGLVTRFRARRSSASVAAWGEAVSVLACLAAVLLASRTAGYLATTWHYVRAPDWNSWAPWGTFAEMAFDSWPLSTPWLVAVPLLCLRRWRLASVAAVAAVLVDLAGVSVLGSGDPDWLRNVVGPWMLFSVLTALVLAQPRRAARGTELVGPRVLAAVFAVAVLIQGLQVARMQIRFETRVAAAGLALLGLLGARRWLVGTPPGRRVLVVLTTVAVPLAPLFLTRIVAGRSYIPLSEHPRGLMVAITLVALIALSAAVRRWELRRARPVADPTPSAG
jgi:hypothetical protein